MDKKLLASRLHNIFKKQRDRLWTGYVYRMSTIYNISEEHFNRSQKMDLTKQFDRNLVLINQSLFKAPMIQSEDFGYILGDNENEVYQLGPTINGKNNFIKVENAHASQCIYQLILTKPEGQSFATTKDLETIYNSFYNESNPEPLQVPEYMWQQKSINLQEEDKGSFLSYRHAPSYFAHKKHVEKCVSKQLEEEGKIREHYQTLNLNEEQKNTKTLLGLSWRYLARENFSFEPLEELFFPRNANDKTKAILMAEQTLGMNTRKLEGLKRLEEDLSKENYNDLLVIVYLERLKKEIKEDIIDKNVFITLILSLAGVVSAPVVFFIGVLFVIPAYFYQAPYFGKPEFFYDVLVWFIESLLTALSCLIFPIAMYHSYQTTGSMNILKGECARMIDTLLEEIEKEKNTNVVTDVTLSIK